MANKGIPHYGYGGIPAKVTGVNVPVAVKFNPGYVWAVQHGSGGDATVNNIISWSTVQTEMNTYSALRALLMRINWRDIETSEGVYDWTKVRKVYNTLIAFGGGNATLGIAGSNPKRTCVLFEFRSSSSTGNAPDIVPEYIKNGAVYDTGTYISASVNTPQNVNRYMRLWNAPLLARLKAFFDAFALEFNTRPYFEMLQFSEAVVGAPLKTQGGVDTNVPPVPADYATTYPAKVKELVLYANTKMTQTIVMQLCNYPRDVLTTYIPSLRDNGVGVSCPNSMVDEPGLWTTGANIGIWRWFQRVDAATLQNVVPIGPSIQKPECYYGNMSWDDVTGLNGLSTKPGQNAVPPYGKNGAKEIVDMIKANSSANYIFITRAPLDPNQAGVNNPNAIIYTNWLDFLDEAAQTANAWGGLNNTVPSKIA